MRDDWAVELYADVAKLAIRDYQSGFRQRGIMDAGKWLRLAGLLTEDGVLHRGFGRIERCIQMPNKLDPNETVVTTDGTPKPTRWVDQPGSVAGKLLAWNIGANSAVVEVIQSTTMLHDTPTGTVNVLDSATIAAGAAHVFDGATGGGLFVRFAPSSAGQQTSLRFLQSAGPA